MDVRQLAYLVLALYCVSATFVVLLVVRRGVVVRQARRHAEMLDALRPQATAAFLEDESLPQLSRAGQEALLELALKYVALIRGAEADRIVACLERQGMVRRLLDDLAKPSEWTRARAADTLGRLRVARAVPALTAAMHDHSEQVRTVAARSLALIGDVSSVPALARALLDPSRWTLSLIAENLLLMGPRAVAPLLGLVDGDDHNVRVAAVQILGEIRDPAATPHLSRVALDDPSLNLRARAAAALGRLGGPTAAATLLEALHDPTWQVRAQTAKALGAIGDPAAAEPLSRAIHDREWWVRVNCAEALVRLGRAGIRRLRLMETDDDPYVRDAARAALGLAALGAQMAQDPGRVDGAAQQTVTAAAARTGALGVPGADGAAGTAAVAGAS